MAADRASDAIAAHTISRRDIRTHFLPHSKRYQWLRRNLGRSRSSKGTNQAANVQKREDRNACQDERQSSGNIEGAAVHHGGGTIATGTPVLQLAPRIANCSTVYSSRTAGAEIQPLRDDPTSQARPLPAWVFLAFTRPRLRPGTAKPSRALSLRAEKSSGRLGVGVGFQKGSLRFLRPDDS